MINFYPTRPDVFAEVDISVATASALQTHLSVDKTAQLEVALTTSRQVGAAVGPVGGCAATRRARISSRLAESLPLSWWLVAGGPAGTWSEPAGPSRALPLGSGSPLAALVPDP